MSSSAKHKERQRRKRQEKRATLQRAQGGSVYRRIGAADELVACYVNRDWHEEGIATIHVLKRGPGGVLAVASFLVDIWCMGLKDVGGCLDVTTEDFQDTIDRCPAEIELVRVDPEVVKKLVAGGVRFAQRNGFRLPHKYDRWTAVLGPLPEPDLADFGVGGKLRFVGQIQQLRERLIGSTVDRFLARPDVEFIAEAEDFGPLEESEDDAAYDEAFERICERMVDSVRRWCFAHGQVPHPRLAGAVGLTIDSVMIASQEVEADAPEDERYAALTDVFDSQAEDFEPEERAELQGAFDQLSRFAAEYETPAQMYAALGIDELFEDEPE